MLTNALQARGAATESLIVNISRQGLIYIPSMFILGAIFHETGLIWAQPVADVLSLLLAIGLYFRMSGKGNDLSSKGFGTIPKVIYWHASQDAPKNPSLASLVPLPTSGQNYIYCMLQQIRLLITVRFAHCCKC